MTDTDHQPHTTTDNLTDWLARYLCQYRTDMDWDRLNDPGRAAWRYDARALLTSGPLADRLNAHTRIETLADEADQRRGVLTGMVSSAALRAAVRGDR